MVRSRKIRGRKKFSGSVTLSIFGLFGIWSNSSSRKSVGMQGQLAIWRVPSQECLQIQVSKGTVVMPSAISNPADGFFLAANCENLSAPFHMSIACNCWTASNATINSILYHSMIMQLYSCFFILGHISFFPICSLNLSHLDLPLPLSNAGNYPQMFWTNINDGS